MTMMMTPVGYRNLHHHPHIETDHNDDDDDDDDFDDDDDETCRLPQPSVIRKAACSPFTPGTKAPK